MINKNKRGFGRKMLLGIALLFSVLIVISSITALGVTPGRTTLDFSPNLEKEIKFSVVNSENKEMNVAFSVNGELAEYINITNQVVHLSASESSREFSYKLKLPQSLSSGLKKADIIITEIPEGAADSGTVIKATVSVVTQLFVKVSYPGKNIDLKIDIASNKGDTVNFYLPIVNQGTEDIKNLRANIDIYDGESRVGRVKSNKISLQSGERKELALEWIAGSRKGEHRAVAIVSYDGKKAVIEKNFTIGEEELNVLGVSVNDFKLGGVAKIKILVQNSLSEDIANAFVTFKIYDSHLDEIAKLKSESYTIPAGSNKEMVIYWDTENLEKGRYDSEMKLDYIRNFIIKNFKIDVKKNSMTFSGVGFVIAEQGSGKISITTILVMVIGFLFLINIAWVVWWMRTKNHRKS